MAVFYVNGRKYNCYRREKPYFMKTITLNGKRMYVYGDGEKDANKKIEALKEAAARGEDVSLRNAETGKTMRYWLFNVKRVDRDLKASSFARYESTFRVHIEPASISHIKLTKLSSAQLQAYVTSLSEDENLSSATIQFIVRVLKMFFSWAVDEGYITKNPSRRLTLTGERTKGKKRKIEVFSEEERKKIVSYMAESKYQYDTVVLLALATGMREGELLALKWGDIDFEKHELYVRVTTNMVTHVDKDGNRDRYREIWDPKSDESARTIPLLESTCTLLRAHQRKQLEFFMAHGIRSDYVFTTNTGQLVDPSSFVKSYKRMLERAGVPYRKFHTTRHTFATEAIRRGVHVEDLRKILGHADIATTYIYVQASEESKRNAIELMGAII